MTTERLAKLNTGMRPLIVICGATATGKTDIALNLASMFNGELISADSRQVYRELTIGTGKDIPHHCKLAYYHPKRGISVPYYQCSHTRIWGYDLAQIEDDFNSAAYVSSVQVIMNYLYKRHVLPILVGGTGHYIQSVISPPPTLSVPKNEALRQKLEHLSVNKLQVKLKRLAPNRWSQLNHSDQNNPRRLIRAIEVAHYKTLQIPTKPRTINKTSLDPLWIGLRLNKNNLKSRISKRIDNRLEEGMLEEVKRVQLNQLPPHLPAKQTLGYQELQAYLDNHISLEKAKQLWLTAELQYAKRQQTWFKKNPEIHWFDPLKTQTLTLIVELVRDWYSEIDESKN